MHFGVHEVSKTAIMWLEMKSSRQLKIMIFLRTWSFYFTIHILYLHDAITLNPRTLLLKEFGFYDILYLCHLLYRVKLLVVMCKEVTLAVLHCALCQPMRWFVSVSKQCQLRGALKEQDQKSTRCNISKPDVA